MGRGRSKVRGLWRRLETFRGENGRDSRLRKSESPVGSAEGQWRGRLGVDTGWGWGGGQGLATQRYGACSSFVWLGEAFGRLVGVQEEQRTPES